MKIRIIPKSRGTKGVDWERYFLIQIKTFLWWSNWKEFKSIYEAMDIMKLFNVTSIEYKVN